MNYNFLVSIRKTTFARRFFIGIGSVLLLFGAVTLHAGQRQMLQGHFPQVDPNNAIGRLAATNRINLTFSLPLRHRPELTNFLRQLYQPGSPSFHHFLKPKEFADTYGPTESDYQSVVAFAKAHNLTVRETHANRTMLGVSGAVGDIESALHVHLHSYRHPTENRTFFAPDAQPSVDLRTPMLAVGGLHNFTKAHPCLKPAGMPAGVPQQQQGSGPSGSYFGGDFRGAYAAGVSLTGTGQSVGLFELDGYNPSDITNYETTANIVPFVPLQNVLIDGFNGSTNGSGDDAEVCLDIEMAAAMAPGLSSVIVYEGTNASFDTDDILNRMATDDAASQLSCSWVFEIGAATDQILLQFAAQGQTFYQASGDSDSYYPGPVYEIVENPYVTAVGGTILSTTAPLGPWSNESVWNQGAGQGSGGGVSTIVPIPFWQQGVSMVSNGGSTTMRNVPDVAMVAYFVWVDVTGRSGQYRGTSIAAPLWAGFTALVNQQAAINGRPPLGFANPAIYGVGKSSNYATCFHDVVQGDNTSTNSPNNYFAVRGYDLCTGWGSPIGSNLISALLTEGDALAITPTAGFTVFGPIGGPFNVTSQTFLLTNTGNAPLNWTAGPAASWFTLSPVGGTLNPGQSVIVQAALTSAVSNYLIGNFTGEISFTNLQDNVAQSWPVALYVGNGGFETGNFTNWNFNGDTNACFAAGDDLSDYPGVGDPLPNVPFADVVHSGRYGAFMGQPSPLALLSQSIPTVPQQNYYLSFWLSSLSLSGFTQPNEFQLQWNGATIFDGTNLPAFGWTNFQYLLPATASATTLQFGFRDIPAAFGLDDVSVQAVPPAVFQTVSQTNGNIHFSWIALPGLVYQLQYATNLAATNWVNLGPATNAVSTNIFTMDAAPPDARRFYRFVVSP